MRAGGDGHHLMADTAHGTADYLHSQQDSTEPSIGPPPGNATDERTSLGVRWECKRERPTERTLGDLRLIRLAPLVLTADTKALDCRQSTP
jgi:hypothetical protein